VMVFVARARARMNIQENRLSLTHRVALICF
jgi:hypothetical protein